MWRAGIVVLVLLFGADGARSELLFEGYYKIEVNGVHCGFVIQRHESAGSAGQDIIAYYVYRKENGIVSQIGVSARSDRNRRPLSYSYYEWFKDHATVVRGRLSGTQLEVRKYAGSGEKIIEQFDRKSVLPRVIFSSLVTQFLATRDSEMYREGFDRKFNGLSEEYSRFDQGRLEIARSHFIDDQRIFQVRGSFLNEPFELFTFANGELLGSRNAIMSMVTYLVASQSEATAGFDVNSKNLKKVFGDLPGGMTINLASQSRDALDAKTIIASFAP